MFIHFKTLGCRLNEAELETWAQGFQTAGHRITQELALADIVVINSCAVTADATRKSRQMVRRVHHQNPRAKLVLSGCYATLNADEAAGLLGVDLVISNNHKNQLVADTLSQLNIDTMPTISTEPDEFSLFSRGRQRAFIKVQDGCRYRCTFCIVTVARGQEMSRLPEDIVNEINALHQQGVNEVVLTGVHLGGYGNDIGSHLGHLIRTILQQTHIPRIRMGSLEPWQLPIGFFELFTNPRLMPHLHIPLQSGSDSVLRRMARRCKTTEFADVVQQARDKIKCFNITTDIIVGFPGETEQEWQQGLRFIESIGFGHIHIFSYSSRQGTKAATLPQQLPNAIKKQRSRHLHQLATQMQQQFIAQNINQQYAVLWEGHKQIISDSYYLNFGYTPNYLRVSCRVSNTKSINNKIINARLKTAVDKHIFCELRDG